MTNSQIKTLRANINAAYYAKNMARWNELCAVLKAHTDAQLAAAPKVEFFSVDSGQHRTMLASGRAI